MIYVDSPVWPGKGPAGGRLWAHMVSDVSYDELHAFAETLGVPRRGFDRDHYDIAEGMVPLAIDLGATHVSSRELVRRLIAGGLRRPRPIPPPPS